MRIPRTIHYCWFGGKSLPSLAQKCIQSWRKHCPDYEIVCWNEENAAPMLNAYAKEALAAGKWAFVSDYVRLKVIYEQGGIYFDTDVELLKPIEPLLADHGFIGLDEAGVAATGLGFAAEPGNAVIGALLADYEGIHFTKPDGTYDTTPCPVRNAESLKRLGVDVSIADRVFMGIRFLPTEYLCPMHNYTGKTTITENTYSVHHYCASWVSPTAKRTIFMKRLLGVRLYNKLYGKFLHRFKWLEW